jgi:hypothetical protein
MALYMCRDGDVERQCAAIWHRERRVGDEVASRAASSRIGHEIESFALANIEVKSAERRVAGLGLATDARNLQSSLVNAFPFGRHALGTECASADGRRNQFSPKSTAM